MKITAIDHGLDLSQSFNIRTPGVHMSDLLAPLYASLEPKRYAKKKSDSPPTERWAIGMAFEEILETGLRNRIGKVAEDETVVRPGEFETKHTASCLRPRKARTTGCGCACGGGILYSPDLLVFNSHTRVAEIKLHTMSHNFNWKPGKKVTLPSKFDRHLSQLKVYAFHLGTTLGRLYPFSMREMVYFNEPKIFLPMDIEWEWVELQEEWEWVLDFAVKEGVLRVI